MGFQHLLLAASLPLAALGVKRSTPSTFQLYAYGESLGGLPLFYADGYAYLGDPNVSNSSDAATVILSPGSDTTVWYGAPNTTDLANSTTPDWSNVTLYVPGPSASDDRVGFLSSNDSTPDDAVTSGFFFYGSNAMLLNAEGDVESLWFAGPRDDSGARELYWNSTDSSYVAVAMRRVAPTISARERRRK